MTLRFILLALTLAACAAPDSAAPVPQERAAPLASEAQMAAAEDVPLDGDWAEFAAPETPFTVIANVHSVGTKGVNVFLITTPEGHILIDSGPAQGARIVLANIRTLGFDPTDVRYVLNTHAHWDHGGGIARIAAETSAQVVASAPDRDAIESGHIAYGPASEMDSPPVRVDRVVADGEILTLGGVTVTAVLMPGHTKGCTSWRMEAPDSTGRMRTVFFHCSSTVAGQSLVPEAWPGIVAAYRATFARLRTMQADVFLPNHPNYLFLTSRGRMENEGAGDAFVDPSRLAATNESLAHAFEEELARQQRAAAGQN